MPRLLADVNFKRPIIDGLRRHIPELDAIRAQEVGHDRTADPDLLEWAANEERVLLTHDVRTMRGYAYARLAQGLPISGVILVHNNTPIGRAIEGILLLLATVPDEEWDGVVEFVPL